MSTVTSPAEITEQPQDEGSTAAEFSFLHAPLPWQNQLKWVPFSDTIQEGKVLKAVLPKLYFLN